MTIQLGNVGLAKKEQERRRTILIGVKNLVQEELERGRTIGIRNDGSYVDLKYLYDDLQNFLYGKDCIGLPYLVSIEELNYYVNLWKDMKETMEKDLYEMLEEA